MRPSLPVRAVCKAPRCINCSFPYYSVSLTVVGLCRPLLFSFISRAAFCEDLHAGKRCKRCKRRRWPSDSATSLLQRLRVPASATCCNHVRGSVFFISPAVCVSPSKIAHFVGHLPLSAFQNVGQASLYFVPLSLRGMQNQHKHPLKSCATEKNFLKGKTRWNRL